MAKEKRAKPSTSRSSSNKRGSFQDVSQDGYANERGLGDDVLGLALSSQYDDTDLPGEADAIDHHRAPHEGTAGDSAAEGLAYYEALGDKPASSSSRGLRASSSAHRRAAAHAAASMSTAAPARRDGSVGDDGSSGDDDDNDDDSSGSEGGRDSRRGRHGKRAQRRDRTAADGGDKKWAKKKRAQQYSDDEPEQQDVKRAEREYMVGEIDERELVIGRRIAWYPNGPGWIEKVYHGMWRGRQVIIKIPRIKELKGTELRRFRKAVAKRITVAHPNVVSCLGACTVPGRFKLIEETLDEGGFSRLLRAHRHSPAPLSPNEGQWSLFHRMLMASDIASGMAWLHSSVPPIVYGDLNSSNLSVEYREGRAVIKVANFGFPMLCGPSYYPHKAAPEVLGTPLSSHQSFTKEADVYAFGLILWELLTTEEPYPYFANLDELIEAVCRQKERPPLPDDCPTALRQLIQACWYHESACRPDFVQITARLDEIFIRMAVRDEEGQRFWIENFPKQQAVEWGVFVRAFYRFLKVRPPRGRRLVQSKGSANEQLREKEREEEEREEMVMQCFKALVVSKDPVDEGTLALGSRIAVRKKEMVHIQQFGRILDWFGPVSKNVTLPPPRPSTCDEALVSPRKQALMRKGKGGGAACTKEKSASGHGSHKDGRRAGSGKRRAATRRKRAGRGHYASESDDDSESSSEEEEADVTDSSESDSESEEESERDAKSKRVDFASVLPVELSLAIFRYFDEYDWTDLQSVCRNWATIINVLRNKQQRRLRRRPSRDDQAKKGTKNKKKSRIDPKTFHLARGMSTGALSLSSVKNKHHAGNSHSGGKLIDSLQDKKHGGAGSKMERMGKNFKSSALLTRKRRTKGGGGDDSSSSSSEDTDGDVDTPPAFAAPSKRERRRERRHHQDKDDSAYCSWSDDDDDECDMDSWEMVPEANPKRTILDAIHAVLTQKWFHGDIETADATYRIQSCPQGTFLVRFSTNATHPGAFTITRVAAGPSIGHIRITRSDDGKGRFMVNKDMVFDSLVETIESTKNILGLTSSCPGSPFYKKFGVPSSSATPSSASLTASRS